MGNKHHMLICNLMHYVMALQLLITEHHNEARND